MNLKKIPADIKVFGDTGFRGKCPLEVAEQVSFLALLGLKYPDLAAIAVHIRNEGKRTARQGFNQKQEGMNTGASDIVIPCNPPILIELKRRDHTLCSVSAKQIDYLSKSQEQGAFACLALGAAGAMEAVEQWHTSKDKN